MKDLNGNVGQKTYITTPTALYVHTFRCLFVLLLFYSV